jgi:hypothetical protein
MLIINGCTDIVEKMFSGGFCGGASRALREPVYLGSLTRKTGRCATHPPIAHEKSSLGKNLRKYYIFPFSEIKLIVS